MDGRDINLAVNILDALECGKDALSLLPQLPLKMKPVHLRILNAIYRIRDETGSSRVSDISKASGLLLPNATKFINQLVELNIVDKFTSGSDKRVVLVRTTAMGEQYIQKYVLAFHKGLADEFSKIGESSRLTMIETIHQVCQAIRKVYENNRR